MVRFHFRGGESLLAVGTVTGVAAHPLGHRESHVALYRVVNGELLQLLHRTSVDGDGSDKDDGGRGTVLSLALVHWYTSRDGSLWASDGPCGSTRWGSGSC